MPGKPKIKGVKRKREVASPASSSSSSSAVRLQLGEWACKQCTFANRKGSDDCVMCETPREGWEARLRALRKGAIVPYSSSRSSSSSSSSSTDLAKPEQTAGPLKVVEKGKKERKLATFKDGSKVRTDTKQKEKNMTDRSTGKRVESKHVTKSTKLQKMKGKTVETKTIVVKRITYTK